MLVYAFAAGREGERAGAHLGNFAGILQVDGDGGYAALAKRRRQIQLAFCWAHVRGKFYELADSSPVGAEVLRRIAQLPPSRTRYAAVPSMTTGKSAASATASSPMLEARNR